MFLALGYFLGDSRGNRPCPSALVREVKVKDDVDGDGDARLRLERAARVRRMWVREEP